MEQGNFDANLGGNLYKKRIAIKGQGKRGGARTIVAYKVKEKIVFLYAFEKNQRANITDNEKKALKKLGNFILDLNTKELLQRITDGSLIEIKEKEDGR